MNTDLREKGLVNQDADVSEIITEEKKKKKERINLLKTKRRFGAGGFLVEKRIFRKVMFLGRKANSEKSMGGKEV